MNVIEAIATLRHDLDRTIESLEALRNGFAGYAEVAPVLHQPYREIDLKKADPRLSDFLTKACRTSEGSYVRVTDLWRAYVRWCRRNDVSQLGRSHFASRVRALGYEYSRSRRVRGLQVRTWEGLKLAKKAG